MAKEKVSSVDDYEIRGQQCRLERMFVRRVEVTDDIGDFPQGPARSYILNNHSVWYDAEKDIVRFYKPHINPSAMLTNAIYALVSELGPIAFVPEELRGSFLSAVGREVGLYDNFGQRRAASLQGKSYIENLSLKKQDSFHFIPVIKAFNSIYSASLPDAYSDVFQNACIWFRSKPARLALENGDAEGMADVIRDNVDNNAFARNVNICKPGDCYEAAGIVGRYISLSLSALERTELSVGYKFSRDELTGIIKGAASPLGIVSRKRSDRRNSGTTFSDKLIITPEYITGKGYVCLTVKNGSSPSSENICIGGLEVLPVERVASLFSGAQKGYNKVEYLRNVGRDTTRFVLVEDLFRRCGVDYYLWGKKSGIGSAQVRYPGLGRHLNYVANIAEKFVNPKTFAEKEEKFASFRRELELAEKASGSTMSESDGNILTVGNVRRSASEKLDRRFTELTFGKSGEKIYKKLNGKGVFTFRDILSYGFENLCALVGPKAAKVVSNYISETIVPFGPGKEAAVDIDSDVARASASLSGLGQPQACVFFGREVDRLPSSLRDVDIPLPVTADGLAFEGLFLVSMASAMVNHSTRWNDCNVFISRKDLLAMGLQLTPGFVECYASAEGSRQYKYYNLADTDFAVKYPVLLSRYDSVKNLACPKYVNVLAPNFRNQSIEGLVSLFSRGFNTPSLSLPSFGVDIPRQLEKVREVYSSIQKK